MEFGDEGQSLARLARAVDAARECGLAAISANDHFLFQRPWLDGLTALAAMVERSGSMELATTVSLVVLRGPAPLAKALAALDLLSEGRIVAGVGPGSSKRDYDAIGVPYEEGWKAGIRRVARLGDGWLASAYNTSPQAFGAARQALAEELRSRGREPGGFPNALVTMWTWITEDAGDAERVLHDVLAPLLNREPDTLRDQLCVGPPERCAELLSRYARAGCERVHLWPIGDEPRQIELAAGVVLPAIRT